MKKIRKGALCCILLLAIIISSIPMNKEIIKASSDSYLSVRGVDLSSIIAFEKSGQKFYYEDGKQGDIFDILKNSGVNYIRVRVWNNPYDTETGLGYGGGNNDIWKAIEIGKRATEKGTKVFVDFQYSDFWADPAKQYAPKEWKNYSNSQKISSIYQFTFSSLKTLIDSGINVGMVQIGNETNGSMCGMGGLYDGVWNLTSGVGDGLESGCNAVNDINKYYGYSDSKKILRVLHFTDPTTTSEWYAEQVRNVGVDYDVLSVSAYPFWFGHASDLASTLKNISVKYNKKVMVAETAYPYTFNNADDTVNNIGSKEDMTYCDYPISVSGQKQAISDIFNAVASVNSIEKTKGYGLGGFYWEPSWIGTSKRISDSCGTGWSSSVSENYENLFVLNGSQYATSAQGSSWDNMTLFDKNGVALQSLQIFNDFKK